MTISDLTKGLELTEDVIKVFEEVQCDGLRAARTRQGILCLLDRASS